jgi:predicted amidohydrolase
MELKLAAVQLPVLPDKTINLTSAAAAVRQQAQRGADLVVLPEMFICPYQSDLFPLYAEHESGPTVAALSRLARENAVWLVAGMPERDEAGRIYNTAFVFSRQGDLVARHRKIHLFDVDLPGGPTFRESATLTPGDQMTVFATEFGRFGLCICYDLRFPELARRMALADARLLIVPGAFNQTTGPAHWEVLFRCRAIDNQVFTLGCAPARTPEAAYQSWGHSILVDPWGTVLQELTQEPGWFLATIDLDRGYQVRRQLPLLRQLRPEIAADGNVCGK